MVANAHIQLHDMPLPLHHVALELRPQNFRLQNVARSSVPSEHCCVDGKTDIYATNISAAYSKILAILTGRLPVDRHDLSSERPEMMRQVIARVRSETLRIDSRQMGPIMLDKVHGSLLQDHAGRLLRNRKHVLDLVFLELAEASILDASSIHENCCQLRDNTGGVGNTVCGGGDRRGPSDPGPRKLRE